jgi:hypothetical protein
MHGNTYRDKQRPRADLHRHGKLEFSRLHAMALKSDKNSKKRHATACKSTKCAPQYGSLKDLQVRRQTGSLSHARRKGRRLTIQLRVSFGHSQNDRTQAESSLKNPRWLSWQNTTLRFHHDYVLIKIPTLSSFFRASFHRTTRQQCSVLPEVHFFQ